jgi:hypothetical protein
MQIVNKIEQKPLSIEEKLNEIVVEEKVESVRHYIKNNGLDEFNSRLSNMVNTALKALSKDISVPNLPLINELSARIQTEYWFLEPSEIRLAIMDYISTQDRQYFVLNFQTICEALDLYVKTREAAFAAHKEAYD